MCPSVYLHECFILAHAAIHFDGIQRLDSSICFHSRDDFVQLESDGLQDGPYNVGLAGVVGQTNDTATGVLAPGKTEQREELKVSRDAFAKSLKQAIESVQQNSN